VRTLHISIEPKEISSLLNINDAIREEYCALMLEDVDEVLETMRTEEEPLIDDEIQPIETLVESESAMDFKGFEALHNIILNIGDQLLCYDVQTKAGHMYDEMPRSFETFQQNVNRVTLNVKCKKIMHSRQMTLPDVFKQ
jgi:hypothetical protein